MARQFTMQPALRDCPLALDGGGRHSQGGRGLVDGQAAEEPQFDDAGLIGVQLFELLERPVEIERIDGVDSPAGRGQGVIEVEWQAPTTSLLPEVTAGVVDEDAPHQLGGDGEEVASVLPVDGPLAEQLQVRLIDDSGGLKVVVAPLTRELA